MNDFYDDAIVDYDTQVRAIVRHLKSKGVYANTVIFITSDHPARFRTDKRTPLIVRFPHQQYTGEISKNVQAIDVAPSILDYIGMKIPGWMDGRPLLTNVSRGTKRPIIISQRGEEWSEGRVFQYHPPFYSLGGLVAVVGRHWYHISLPDGKFDSRLLGAKEGIDSEGLGSASTDAGKDILIKHLQDNGYDVSALGAGQ